MGNERLISADVDLAIFYDSSLILKTLTLVKSPRFFYFCRKEVKPDGQN
ncbi:MAG: hypothetical protein ACRC2J_05055 [Microcoleaceae cyanobacterium]